MPSTMPSPFRLGSRDTRSETPSRYDAILARRRRQSFSIRQEDNDDGQAGGGNAALPNGTGTGFASTRSRRKSMAGFGEIKPRSETPTSGRRNSLAPPYNHISQDPMNRNFTLSADAEKRKRVLDAPPLPPSHNRPNTLPTLGSGSYYSRKQQRVATAEADDNHGGTVVSSRSYQRRQLADDGISDTFPSREDSVTFSPNVRRQNSSPGPRSKNIQTSVLYEDSPIKQRVLQSPDYPSSVENDENCRDVAVEDAGIHSQVQRMKQRIDQLEKEKMDLSMSMAPLEARIRQKEEAWHKDEARLLREINSTKVALQEADERHRDLEVKLDDLQSENKQLRMDARKATKQRPVFNENSWSKQLRDDDALGDVSSKLKLAEEEIDSIRLSKVSVEKELHATKIAFDSLIRNFEQLEAEYEVVASSSSQNKEAEIKLNVLTAEHMATSAQLNAVCVDLASTKAQADAAMKAKDEEHQKEIEQIQFEMSVLKSRAGKAVADEPLGSDSVEDEAVLRARIEERDRRIAQLEAELLKGEQVRRQMHNTIQELRGNIRVFVRTRPFLPGDRQSSESPIDVCPDGESLSIIDPRTTSSSEFKFDKVFPPSAGQDAIFHEVSDFIQSALDGYSVCLFSYGQTGSGKTHTMQGCGNGAMRGIIPRAVQKILDQAGRLSSQKWNFKISASFLEIYNETLKDLLISMNSDSHHSSGKNGKLAIKRTKEGKSYVDGLTEAPIETIDADVGADQLAKLMAVAARSRSVACTKMNSQSSRSHSIFVLHLRGVNGDTGAVVHGTLNLCDLAGSERLDRSGAGDDKARLKETQAINKSLSCLGDVFRALSTGASHVPFRNSKLTYLLQDCLSGDGKALMMVNLSPTTASSSESVCSLRFAQRVNQVELGKATKNIQYSGKGPTQKLR